MRCLDERVEAESKLWADLTLKTVSVMFQTTLVVKALSGSRFQVQSLGGAAFDAAGQGEVWKRPARQNGRVCRSVFVGATLCRPVTRDMNLPIVASFSCLLNMCCDGSSEAPKVRIL